MDCDGCERRVKNVVRRMKGSLSHLSLGLWIKTFSNLSFFFSPFCFHFLYSSCFIFSFKDSYSSLKNQFQFYSWLKDITIITNHLFEISWLEKTVQTLVQKDYRSNDQNLSFYIYTKRVIRRSIGKRCYKKDSINFDPICSRK